MTAHNLSATVTDVAGASDTDTHTLNSTAAAPQRSVRRSLMLSRTNWSSIIDQSVNGPWLSSDDPEIDYTPGTTSPPDPTTLGHTFWVLIPCRFVGCRIYKAPLAEGTDIPVAIWSGANTAESELLGSTTIDEWVADGGGWRQIDFPTPVELVPDTPYTVGFFSGDGHYAFNIWFWHAQDTVIWPIHHKMLQTTGIGVNSAGNPKSVAATFEFPDDTHEATNYYIDVQVEYDDPLPEYVGGYEYWDQWTHPVRRHPFMVAVFYADPPYLQQYYDTGVNTLIRGDITDEYFDAFNAMGNTMDWWAPVDEWVADPLLLFQTIGENPDIADQLCGYILYDEPDSATNGTSAQLLEWHTYIRQHDSTRPIYINFGTPATVNQTWLALPPGAGPLLWNVRWRETAALCDVISCDRYRLSDYDNADGRHGIWDYAAQIVRMGELNDNRTPIWAIIETTSYNPGQPAPEVVRRCMWATIIAGARGIIFFDHRFGGGGMVEQDFNAMVSDPLMMAMVAPMSALLQELADALHGPDLGLVTAVTSSNTTEGPVGGTFGVPLHYTSREDDTYEYVFAQGIRPGSTTGTLTIPSWAGAVVTVIDESRTETVSGGGVLTDDFAADYTVHLYRRTK